MSQPDTASEPNDGSAPQDPAAEPQNPTKPEAARPEDPGQPEVIAASGATAGPMPADVEVIEPQVVSPEIVRLRAEAEMARTEAYQAKARAREVENNLRAVSKKYRELEDEMNDFRRRMQQNADVRIERKVHEMVGVFFDPVMNLKRALAASAADSAAVIDGVKMVSQQFADALAKIGLVEIPGVGSTFDPAIHEALAVMPVADAAQDGKVLEVYAIGYRVGSTVLQPAQVVIGKFETPAEA
jgi:molecular chaperone GrpE